MHPNLLLTITLCSAMYFSAGGAFIVATALAEPDEKAQNQIMQDGDKPGKNSTTLPPPTPGEETPQPPVTQPAPATPPVTVTPVPGRKSGPVKVGDPDRKAICDVMREYVKKDASRPLPKPLLFKVNFMYIEGDYAGFSGTSIFADDSNPTPEYLPDIVYVIVFKWNRTRWEVVADLSRTDVPDQSEIAAIRKRLPAGMPPTVLPENTRRMLGL
jgi:hypothetical protein